MQGSNFKLGASCTQAASIQGHLQMRNRFCMCLKCLACKGIPRYASSTSVQCCNFAQSQPLCKLQQPYRPRQCVLYLHNKL
jgi:hypothetical protein